MIPSELGCAEGFYVYKGNTRCLTDGTGGETILNEIIVDGETYEADEFEIVDCSYMPTAHEIFYLLSLSKENQEVQYCLYHHNYETKESAHLYTLDNVGRLHISGDYAFWDTEKKSVLINSDAQIVSEELTGFTLEEDILYKWEGATFSWWMDGKLQSVTLEGKIGLRYANGFAYFMQGDKITIVNLNSGEVANHYYDGEKIEIGGNGASNMRIGDAYYVVTKSDQNDWRIWRAENGEVTYLGDISDDNGEIIDVSLFQCNDEFVNFSVRKQNKEYNDFQYSHVAYYVNTGEIKLGRSTLQPAPPIEVIVGEYRFYIQTFRLGDILAPTGAGYYLRRVKDGKDEIMQYYFNDEEGYDVSDSYCYRYFDDIYVK